ncbi:hypothetical protein FQR65_LT06933 [Abscondita terminalis]|nr:hypothetical protein FQR65_LT06933 [Abscondita terminalis]
MRTSQVERAKNEDWIEGKLKNGSQKNCFEEGRIVFLNKGRYEEMKSIQKPKKGSVVGDERTVGKNRMFKKKMGRAKTHTEGCEGEIEKAHENGKEEEERTSRSMYKGLKKKKLWESVR